MVVWLLTAIQAIVFVVALNVDLSVVFRLSETVPHYHQDHEWTHASVEIILGAHCALHRKVGPFTAPWAAQVCVNLPSQCLSGYLSRMGITVCRSWAHAILKLSNRQVWGCDRAMCKIMLLSRCLKACRTTSICIERPSWSVASTQSLSDCIKKVGDYKILQVGRDWLKQWRSETNIWEWRHKWPPKHYNQKIE